MKLQPDRFDVQAITGYGPGWVGVGTQRYTHSLVVSSQGELFDWAAVAFEQLEAAHFERLAGLGVQVLIFGSGSRIRFPRPVWLRPLVAAGIGMETMDTAAACRTYNVLAQEGRRVAAALLLEQPA